MTAPRLDHYDWHGGREAMLRFGPAEAGLVVIAALPLFEEANRTRTLMVAILRALADRGVASVLPDVPGQGESLVPTHRTDLAMMRDAHVAIRRTIPHERVHAVAIRSGALLDATTPLAGRWHFAPQTGAALQRELGRLRHVAAGAPGEDAEAPIEIAGNLVSPRLLAGLADAAPISVHPIRTARMADDPASADVRVTGRTPWRTAEPECDPVMAGSLADDIADWIATCAG